MKKYFIYPALSLFVLFTACNDGENFQGPTDDDPKTANEYFKSNLEEMLQEFTVDMSEAPVTVKSKGGITLTIHPGSFTISGEVVEGKVHLELYEMLSLSSIALSGTNTNYAGNSYQTPCYFETDGFFRLEASVDGKKVDEYLASYISVTVPMGLSDRDWTLVWEGTEEAGDEGDQFAWVNPDGWEAGEAWSREGMEEFHFNLGKLGWCNCDYFWYGEHTLTVTLTGRFGKFANYLAADGDTYVMFAAKGSPVLAQLYTFVNESTVKSYDKSMPDGATGRLFAFSIVDGVYTYAEKEITISSDLTETLEMKVTTKDHIDSRLASLDGYK